MEEGRLSIDDILGADDEEEQPEEPAELTAFTGAWSPGLPPVREDQHVVRVPRDFALEEEVGKWANTGPGSIFKSLEARLMHLETELRDATSKVDAVRRVAATRC